MAAMKLPVSNAPADPTAKHVLRLNILSGDPILDRLEHLLEAPGGWQNESWVASLTSRRMYRHIATGTTVADVSFWPFTTLYNVRAGYSFIGYVKGRKAKAAFRLMQQRAEEQASMEASAACSAWLRGERP